MNDRALQMFTADDEEWVIAYDAEDAVAVYRAHVGWEVGAGNVVESADEADTETHVEHWVPLFNDKTLTLRTECEKKHVQGETCSDPACKDGEVRTTKTVRGWIASHGRGHWGSANW
jgi:hypothetical protein